MIDVVNVVAGGDLNREVDIELLCSELSKVKNIEAEFTDGINWQLVINFHKFGKILLYRTGSYIIRGGSSLDALEDTKRVWFDLIRSEGLVDNISNVEYTLQNIVFSGDLGREINLTTLLLQLGMNSVEYEPEQFPGLIYRPHDYSVVMLIFSTGKTIITGGTKQKEAEKAIEHVKRKLKSNDYK
jgi:transcription initiation factor TFIID TATA-box-binding protein